MSTEVYTAETRFDISFPFKKKKKNRVYGSFEGLTMGTLFSTDNLSNFNEAGGFVLAGQSNEISLNPLQYTLTLVPGYLGLTSGVGMTWRNLHLTSNMHFVENDAVVSVDPAPEGIQYYYSRLRTFEANLPFYIDIHPTGNKNSGFYLSGGILLGLNAGSSSKVKYRDENNKKVKIVEGKNYNINPFSLSYVSMIGFDYFGLYAKYTPTPFFKNGKGPDFQTLAVGVVIPFD